MKKIYPPEEYRLLGRKFSEFMHHWARVRALVSAAYPFKSKLYLDMVNAHDLGVFAMKCRLETLACEEHPTEQFYADFNFAAHEHFKPSLILPGCSAQETDLLESAYRRRIDDKKKKPLNVDELRVISKFIYHIDQVCWGIVEKTNAIKNTSPATAQALLLPFLIVGQPLFSITKEIIRLRDEQGETDSGSIGSSTTGER